MRWRLLVALLLGAAACGDSDAGPVQVAPDTTLPIESPVQPTAPSAELQGLSVEVVGRFDEPTWVAAPAGDDRLFVVEKRGVVWVQVDDEWHRYLDLSEFVSSDGPELGMTGLAFHPDFAGNGRLFIYYTNQNRDSRLVEFSGEDTLTAADPDPARVVLAVDQPQQWHNGGTLHFGPDGYLWLSLGDGGGIGDQYGNAQDPSTLLGSLLRIDVNDSDPYAIPPSNPGVDGPAAPEVWAWGLRNPYRFFVDAIDRTVYIADVGQERWEELNVVALTEPGQNFGWPVAEGTQCYVDILLDPEPASVPCSKEGFVDPVVTYPHGPACAIVGGPVYRGQQIPELWGHYVFSDWCAGFLRTVRVEGGVVVDRADWTPGIGDVGRVTAIGTDGFGEMYLTASEGNLYRIVAER